MKRILDKAGSLLKKTDDGKLNIDDVLLKAYEIYVKENIHENITTWPIISGSDRINGTFKNYIICIFKHTGNKGFSTSTGIGEIHLNLKNSDENNVEIIRKELQKYFNLDSYSTIFIIDNSFHPDEFKREIEVNFMKHKVIMNKEPMKIFLSHKGANKEIVRKYNNILKALGFLPWLDEEAMSAGSNLNRAIHDGVADSCATVFFITDEYIDEDYLSDEVDYSIERTKENPNFKIITLVFGDNSDKVPKLLKKYVWKNIHNDLDGLYEIIKALPIEVGPVTFKQEKS